MVDRIVLTQDDIADDWVKTLSWGLDVDTYEAFRAQFPTEDAVGMFVQLPAWNPAPDAIKQGVAAEFPDLVPLFFTMPAAMVKHEGGAGHDQLSHGNWAGINRGTPEYEARMRRVEQKRANGQMITHIDSDGWRLIEKYGDGEYSFDVEAYVEDFMSDELDATIDDLEAGREAENRMPDTRLAAIEELRGDAMTDYEDMLAQSGIEKRAYEVAFTHTSDDGRYESRVESVEMDADMETVTVRGIIHVDGQWAGEFERTVYHNDPTYGNLHVHRDLFKVDESARGEGIAKWFNGNMEDVYLASGVDAVTIYGVDLSYGDYNTAGGPAVWSSQGYDFNLNEGASSYREFARSVSFYIASNPEFVSLPQAIQSNIKDVSDRFQAHLNGNLPDKDLPTPREVWMLGRVGDISGKTGWWPGKSIIGHGGSSQSEAMQGGENGPDGYFVRYLSDKGGDRVSVGQIAAANVRERIARAAVEAREMQPQLPFDQAFITIAGQPIPLMPDGGSPWTIEEID